MATISILSGNRGLPTTLNVNDKLLHQGGEGNVYRTTDGTYIVKLYHKPKSDKQKLLQYVLNLGKNLTKEEEQFLAWPLGIVNQVNGKDRLGVVTRCVSADYQPLFGYMYNPAVAFKQFEQGRSWVTYLKFARGVAATIRSVNGKGMAHSDIHWKNFLANPASGDVVLIDLDGVVVKGFSLPSVMGMPGFIAPEVLQGQAEPNETTDRHSVAVLVLWTLLFRNVMHPCVCYDDQDERKDDDLGYGKYACFSEHPTDRRNWYGKIGVPLFRGGALSYRVLTPKLQSLTEQALVQELRTPAKRPSVVEWERALAEAYDTLITCPGCRQQFIYPYWLDPPPRRQCPFCGQAVRAPFPVILELKEERARGSFLSARLIVVYHGVPLYADIAEPGSIPPFTRQGTPRLGLVAWDSQEKVYRIRNESNSAWQGLAGCSSTIGKGDSIALRPGVQFRFGEKKRLVLVKE